MKQLRITVDGKAYEVTVEVLGDNGGMAGVRPLGSITGGASVAAPMAAPKKAAAPVAEDGAVGSPMSGSIVHVGAKNGDKVTAGQEILVLEAMKMETSISAPTDGVISGLSVTPGTTVEEGQSLFKLES